MTTKKRKVELDNNTLIRIEIKSNGTVSISIDPRFEDFPCILLSTVTRQIQEHYANLRLAAAPCRAIPACQRKVFAVLDWYWPRPDVLRPTCNLRGRYKSMSFANLAAMETFKIEMVDSNILEGQGKEDGKWVQLQSEAFVSNPRFSHLHALRIGDIGWGFDSDGAISLVVNRRVEGEVQQFAYFVQVDLQ